MQIQNFYPATAEFLEDKRVIAIGYFEGDHYTVEPIPDHLREPLFEHRLRTQSDLDVETVIDENGEVIAYKVNSARYHIIVDPNSE